MKIAFYIAEYGDWKDTLISWITGGIYSHCELVFSDKTWCSSSPRDGGVRFKQIYEVSGHWDFLDIPLSEIDEYWLKMWCDTQVGIEYDWRGTIGTLIPFIGHDKSKWFCSEFCLFGLQKLGLFEGVDPSTTTPISLYNIINRSMRQR